MQKNLSKNGHYYGIIVTEKISGKKAYIYIDSILGFQDIGDNMCSIFLDDEKLGNMEFIARESQADIRDLINYHGLYDPF